MYISQDDSSLSEPCDEPCEEKGSILIGSNDLRQALHTPICLIRFHIRPQHFLQRARFLHLTSITMPNVIQHLPAYSPTGWNFLVIFTCGTHSWHHSDKPSLSVPVEPCPLMLILRSASSYGHSTTKCWGTYWKAYRPLASQHLY